MAVDGSGDLYVGNLGNDITVYNPSGTVLRTISQGVSYPRALAIDGTGNLYLANYRSNTVTVYAAGGTNLLSTISLGVSAPDALAFDGTGSVYVANCGLGCGGYVPVP